MSVDFLSEHEEKVNILLKKFEQLREENQGMILALNEKTETIAQLERKQQELQSEISSYKERIETNDTKLKVVTDRIQGLLEKIEAA